MGKNTNPLASLSFDERNAIEAHLRAARALADVVMCGGVANCAPETVHALGEVIYYRLGDLAAALGFDAELQGGQS
ncbi:MAG: hypothetical protein ACREO7_03060 [Pseudoxanthomonas sp.]